MGKIYPNRNDTDFRSREVYGDHHHKKGINSPLLRLKIDMIKDIPIGDSLHLLHLGVMKRLLSAWKDGTCRHSEIKLSAYNIMQVSTFLTTNCRLPREIHRQMRGLDVLAHWKGVECRSFLLYVGIVCLKGMLPEKGYENFLLLVCASHICECFHFHRFLPLAREFLKDFVRTFAKIYGRQYVTSNIHNLIHLVDDVEYLGPLQSFTSYPFENILGSVKRLVRGKKCTLRQVVNRLSEIAFVNSCPIELSELIAAKNENNTYCTTAINPSQIALRKPNVGANISMKLRTRLNNEENGSASYYSYADFATFSLSTDDANRWFYTSDKSIVCLQNIISCQGRIWLYGIEVIGKVNFFEFPVNSKEFDIYAVEHFNIDTDDIKNAQAGLIAKLFDPTKIRCKFVHLKYNSFTRVFIPLLHSRTS